MKEKIINNLFESIESIFKNYGQNYKICFTDKEKNEELIRRNDILLQLYDNFNELKKLIG